jgi:uncharacterized OB-fold protein
MTDIELVAYKCIKCGKIHYPFHDRCLNCHCREFEEIKPEGKAKLLTATQIFNLPCGFNQRFLIVGIAEFENGVRAMGQVKGDSVDDLASGTLMKPSWEPVRTQNGENLYGLKFEPIQETS